jgi:hypothetical protein
VFPGIQIGCTDFKFDDDDTNTSKPVWPTWAVGVPSDAQDVKTFKTVDARLNGLSGGVPTPHPFV